VRAVHRRPPAYGLD
jgi:hypothetical protein